ncbi:DUF881 domain-containing protein, partial [Georgenia sp. 10Sc9-8]|nr:DUF881 domain-containing protein [Georgenia halotolerans]
LPSWVRPRLTSPQVLITLVCLLAGFMVAAQVGQADDESLTGMRQDDLVRLLDELNQRNEELADEGQRLREELAELRSSTSSQQSAQEAVEQQAQVYGVLAGVLPVRGPGIELTIEDPGGTVPAQTLVTILEELRNAGAEAVEISGVRLAASSWIVEDDVAGVIVDGHELSPPYRWTAVGGPETLSGALAIPGGALASVRNNGGEAELVESGSVTIHAVRTLEEPEHAEPVEEDGEG